MPLVNKEGRIVVSATVGGGGAMTMAEVGISVAVLMARRRGQVVVNVADRNGATLVAGVVVGRVAGG
ncbi:hypothetical protein DEO72_LG1g3280 [Vigna unguiculata]|uniref:Uncharacterized protein n=1 Tax=Vigna unguiculata TaxID=3917 RepID=A0A4D6KZK8_VIGUN|nr:hypothetical protein DEO72_LG1g3280 [Vigna unguiculata]